MATRRPAKKTVNSAQARRSTGTRRTAPTKAAPTKRKATPPPAKNERDVTDYATKEPTEYHKAFAKWIIQEVGFEPNDARSKRSAFLMGVSIATAARPAFQSSEWLENWREQTGEAKRGPKPKDATEEIASNAKRKSNRAVVSDAEFEDGEDEELYRAADDIDDDDDDDDDDLDEEEFDSEDDDDDDDEDEDDDDEDEDFEDDDEDEEEPPPPPVKRRPGRPAKAAPRSRTASTSQASATKRAPVKGTGKGAPAKASTRTKAKPADDDDDFLF